MKRWKKIALSLFAAALAALIWASQSGWLLGAARQGLEDALRQASGREVHVGRVTGGFNGWVWIKDLSLGTAPDGRRPDVSVTAQALGLKLNWVQLVLHRRARLEDLRALRLLGAEAYVLLPKLTPAPNELSPSAQAQDPLRALRLALKNAPLPPVKASLEGGRIWGQRAGEMPQLWLDQAELSVQPAAGRLALQGSGLAYGGAQLKIEATADDAMKEAEAQLHFKQLSVAALPLPAGLSASAGTLDGSLRLRAQPGLNGLWPGLSLEGSGHLLAGALRWQGRALMDAGQLRWSLQGQRLDLDSIQASSMGGRWKGDASFDLSDPRAPRLKARAVGTGLDLALLAQAGGAPQGLSLSGRASAEFSGAGPLSATTLTLGLRSSQAQWAGQSLSNLELNWDRDAAASQGINARLAWDQGQASLDASLLADGRQRGSFKAEGVRADWLQSFGGIDAQGKLQAQGHWQGSAKSLTWDAKASSEQLKVGSLDLKRFSMQGWGDSKVLHARVEGDLLGWNGVNADLEARHSNDGAWVLKGSKVYVGSQLLAQADGQLAQATGGAWQGEWKLKAGPWPVQDLPELREKKGLSGTVQAQGSLVLEAKRWSWQLSVDAPDLSRDHVPAALHAKAVGDAHSVTLSALSLRKGEVQGELHWQSPGLLQAALQLQKADLGALCILLGSPQALSGTVSGPLSLQRVSGSQPWSGQADWELGQLRAGGLKIEKATLAGSLDGTRWKLRHWSAEQAEGGQWTAQGQVDLSGREAWSGHSDWQDWRVGTGRWDAKAALSGGKDGLAQAVVSGLRLSGTPQADLRLDLHFGDAGVQSLRADWGSELSVKAQREGRLWDLRADLEKFDPMRVLSLVEGGSASSGAAFSGFVSVKGLGGEEANASLALNGLGQGTIKGLWSFATAKKPLQGSWEWSRVDLNALQSAWSKAGFGPALDMSGSSSGLAVAHGSALSFSASVESFKIEDIPFGPGTLRGSADAGLFKLETLSLGGSGPRLGLRKVLWQRGKDGAWSAEGELEGQDLPYSLFTLGGVARLKASGKGGEGKLNSDWAWLQTGTRRHEALSLETAWKDGAWTLGPKDKKAFRAAGRWEHGDFILSSLDSRQGKGTAQLKGQVLNDGSLSFDGQSNGFPAGEITGLLGWSQDWKGATYGNLSVRGTTTTPRTVISIKIENGAVNGVSFDLAQATVHVEDGWVRLAPLGPIKISRRQAYLMEVEGSIPLDDDDGKPRGDLDVRAKLKEGGLGFFASLPGIGAAQGALDLDLRFSGARADPTVNGSLRVTNGSITPVWLLEGLEKVQLYAQIQDGQVNLQQAEARMAQDGPLLRLEQADKTHPAFVLERWEPERFNLRLRASASGLAVRSTKQLRFLDGVVHPDLLLTGNWAHPALSGSVSFDKGRLEKALVQWPPQFDPPQPKDQEGQEPSFSDRVEWDLVMKARKDVLLHTELAQIFVDTGEEGLRLRGVAPHRSLEGRLTAVTGNVDYLFANFDLASDKPTWVEFLGEDDPRLELQGVKQVRDALLNGQTVPKNVEVRLHAFGPLGQVSMRLDSDDPSLTQDQLASLAGFGVDTSDVRNQSSFFRLLGKAPAAMLTRYARKSGFVDDVSLRFPAVEDAFAGGARGNTPGAQSDAADLSPSSKTVVDVGLGKWFSEKWFVGTNGQWVERRDSKGVTTGVPVVGGRVQYQLPNDARASIQQNVDNNGQSEQRVMLERASSFENYNAKKRRWGQVEPTPGPLSLPTATSTPEPQKTPQK